jgi:dienelactone hydrolase
LDVLREHDLANAAEIVAIGYCFGGSTVLELARAGADIDGVASFHGGLKTEMPAKKGDVEARVLVLHGADDPMVPMSDVEQFMEEMREAGADYQINMYGGAVHSFTNKRADSHGIEGVAYDKKADERSWEALKLFLKDSFNE